MTMKRSLQILLADNGEIVHQVIADYLQDSGHSVDRVNNGCAALEAVEERYYDLALVDVCIPNVDKLSLLTGIREICPEMSVVIITGRRDMNLAIQAMRHGAVDFLTKPVQLLELDAVLEKAVRNRALVVQCMQVEKALRESERRYRLLAESVTDVIWITDMNLRSTYVNPAVTRMLGYDVEEAMTLAWEDILAPTSLEVVKNIFAKELAKEETNQNYPSRLQSADIELLRKDGSTLCVKAKCTSLHDSDGQLVGMLGILHEIAG